MTPRLAVALVLGLTAGVAACNPESACNGGDMLACANLAVHYETGAGVPKDEKKAFDLYDRACKGGIVWACGSLGDFYAHGRTVPVDYARALPLLTRGCENGFTTGCYALAEMLRDGHGVPVDLARARDCFHKACVANRPTGRNVYPSGHEQGCDEERAVAARLHAGG